MLLLRYIIKLSTKTPDKSPETRGAQMKQSRNKNRTRAFWWGVQDSYSLFPTRLPIRMKRRLKSTEESVFQSLASDWRKIGRDLEVAAQGMESAPEYKEVSAEEEATANCGR
jgi:hypothetical protein